VRFLVSRGPTDAKRHLLLALLGRSSLWLTHAFAGRSVNVRRVLLLPWARRLGDRSQRSGLANDLRRLLGRFRTVGRWRCLHGAAQGLFRRRRLLHASLRECSKSQVLHQWVGLALIMTGCAQPTSRQAPTLAPGVKPSMACGARLILSHESGGSLFFGGNCFC